MTNWKPYVADSIVGPTLLRSTFTVETVADTFIDMSGWGRGVVFLNGFNLGRYFSGGPAHSLYVPAALLKEGENEVSVYLNFTYCKNKIVDCDKLVQLEYP